MYELSTLAPVPIDEPCARIDSADYGTRSTVECGVFRRMLERLFPIPDEADAFLVVRQFHHDFGMYREVCVKYLGLDGEKYATHVEDELPQHWDEIALAELQWYRKKLTYQQAVSAASHSWDDVPEPYRGIHPPRTWSSSNGLNRRFCASPDLHRCLARCRLARYAFARQTRSKSCQ